MWLRDLLRHYHSLFQIPESRAPQKSECFTVYKTSSDSVEQKDCLRRRIIAELVPPSQLFYRRSQQDMSLIPSSFFLRSRASVSDNNYRTEMRTGTSMTQKSAVGENEQIWANFYGNHDRDTYFFRVKRTTRQYKEEVRLPQIFFLFCVFPANMPQPAWRRCKA